MTRGSSLEPDGLSEARLAMTAAAITGDSGTLYRLVADLLDDGVPFDTVLFDVLVPAEREIGSRWQRGDYLVSEEHAATATIETVVSLLAGSFDQPEDGAQVVVATAQGDDHSLPGRLVSAHLLFLGYRATFLGANVLASDLEEYLREAAADVLVLSCAMVNQLLGARAVIRAGHGGGVPVLTGGRAFGKSGVWAGPLGADAWVAQPREVAGVLESWHPDPTASEAAARDPSAELMALTAQRSAVLASAEAVLADSSTNSPDGRLAGELALLVGAVEASLLVDDAQVVVEIVDWQRETLAAHGYGAVDPLVTALTEALAPVSPAAASQLQRAARIAGLEPPPSP